MRNSVVDHSYIARKISNKKDVPKEIILFHHFPVPAMISRAKAKEMMRNYMRNIDEKCYEPKSVKIINILIPERSENNSINIRIESLNTDFKSLPKDAIKSIKEMRHYQHRMMKIF